MWICWKGPEVKCIFQVFPEWTNDSSVANSYSSRMKSEYLIKVTIAIKCTSCFIISICLTSHRIMILWLGLWFFRSSFALYWVRMHQPIRRNVWNERCIKNIGYQPLFDERDTNDKNDNFIGNTWQSISSVVVASCCFFFSDEALASSFPTTS